MDTEFIKSDESQRAPRRKDIKAARARQRAEEAMNAPAGNHARRKPSAHPQKRASYKKRSWWSFPVCCVLVCLLVAVIVFSIGATARWRAFREVRAEIEKNTFYPGITVDGVDVSQMTLDEALDRWGQDASKAYAACSVVLTIDGEVFTISPEKMGYGSDYKQVLTGAYANGRYGTFSQRRSAMEKLGGAWGRDYATTVGYDEEMLMNELESIATEVSEPAVEATVLGFSEAEGFTFAEGKNGLSVDVHELMDQVKAAIASGKPTLTVSRKVVSPGRTAEDLAGIFGKISSAQTSAGSSSNNRLINLKLACEAINGLRLEPGDVFSFNQTLGKRTRKKGYKSAPALSSGSHTTQIGGGICQVATTLFNAVAKADMEIVKRYPHSIPSSYVSRGLDATVNWPNQDFQFKNTSDYPIYLVAELSKSKKVTVSVYGRLLEDGVTIKLKGITNSSVHPKEPIVSYTGSLMPGQKVWVEDRRTGYKVTTYRVHYQDGKETEREQLFTSVYPSSRGKVKIGQ